MSDEEEAGATTGDEVVVGEVTAPAVPTHEPFAFKLFNLVQTHQIMNGMRHNDHMRYRQYCKRRLRHLYVKLHHTHGRAGRYKPIAFPTDFQDPRFLEILLVNAERAWGYGMQLKADFANASVPENHLRLRAISKFGKACKVAAELEAMCKVHADQRAQMEAEAYAAYMAALYLVEKKKHAEALAKVLRCRKVCEYLSLASGAEESAFLKAKAQELVPLLRECKYHLGMMYDPDAPDEDDVKPSVAAHAAVDESGLSYRGQGLVIPSEKIKGKLMKCLDMVNNVKLDVSHEVEESATVVDRYGELTSEFRDLLEEIHGDMISAGADGQTSAWRRVESFAREMSTSMNVERNVVLLWGHLMKLRSIEDITAVEARKVCKPEEGMRFCDLLKEDLGGLRELPETSEVIAEAVSTYVTLVLNCRCLFLALCFTTIGKALEAASLMDMLHARVSDVSMTGALEDPMARVHAFFERIHEVLPTLAAQWRCRGLAQLAAARLAAANQKQGADAADEGDGQGADASRAKAQAGHPVARGGFTEFPPRVREVACKPLLFDLAFPSIKAPDIDKVLVRGGSGGDQQKGFLGRVAGAVGGGIGNRLSGLWGGGGGGR